MNKGLLFAASVSLSLALSGCGGGSSSGSDAAAPTPNPTPPVVNARPGGIWEGTILNQTAGSSWQVIGLSLDSGESRFIDELGTQYVANLTVNGSSFSGSFLGVAPVGQTFLDGILVATGTMSGTIVERNRISGSYTVSTGERGSLNLFYNSIHERDSALSSLAGTWVDGNQDAFTVDGQGAVFGQDSIGCVYSGQVSIINGDFNAYRVQLSVSSCGAFNGSYSGLGVLDDYAVLGDNRLFIFQVSNAQWALTNIVLKL